MASATLFVVPLLLLLLVGLSAAADRLLTNPSIPAQQEKDRVVSLPGQPPVKFQHYAGYVTVDGKEDAGKHHFYWFFEAEEEPLKKPVVLWLNGGPGGSSIGAGAAQEIGPFRVTADEKVLARNPYAWNKAANMLFLDSPNGVGFSYSDGCSPSDLQNQTDMSTAQNSYTFLVQWFERFPQFKNNEFYMTGESYAGHFIPQLTELILNKKGSGINLKGIMLGNPLLDDDTWLRGFSASAYHKAIVAEEKTAMDTMYSDLLPQLINIYDIYNDPCPEKNDTAQPAPSTEGYDPCMMNQAKSYFRRVEVQQALHARTEKLCYPWDNLSFDVNDNYIKNISSVHDTVKMVISAKLRFWIYSGDTDGMVPVTVTRYDLEKLALTIKEPWTPWFRNKHQVGGWTVLYDGLTFTTVRGAGHMVPKSRPIEALRIFETFLANGKL